MSSLNPRLICTLVLLSLAGSLQVQAASPRPASAEAMDIDDGTRATMEKETLKQRRRELQTSAALTNMDGCGQINIGNAAPGNGTQRLTSRDTTVIVTGPVINATNCR